MNLQINNIKFNILNHDKQVKSTNKTQTVNQTNSLKLPNYEFYKALSFEQNMEIFIYVI